MTQSHIERIKELFKKLKLGHEWCQRNGKDQSGCWEMYLRSKPIFQELEKLGVSRQFLEALFVFGPLVTEELTMQFADKKL